MFPQIKSLIVGSGKPLVLLHAFPLSHEIWKDIIPPFGYQLILPDFPGFGLSPIQDSDLSLPEAAQGLEKHLKEMGIDQSIVLGGISMGGYWALEFIRQFPHQIQKLLLISTRAGIDKPEGRQNRLNMAEKVLTEGTEYLVAAMVPGLLGKTTLENKSPQIQTVRQWIRQTSPKGIALAQKTMASRRDQTDLLPTIQAETLIIAGKEDALIPYSEAQTMAQSLPNSQLQLIDQVGHLIPLEAPAEFQKRLNAFLI